ncbi:hypothetical protein WJX77_003656 [Trebouxia sp. C0004]
MSAPGLRSVVSGSWTDTLESLDRSCNEMACEQLSTDGINMSGNYLDAAAFTKLPASFWPYIQVLDLSDCGLDSKGISMLRAVA